MGLLVNVTLKILCDEKMRVFSKTWYKTWRCFCLIKYIRPKIKLVMGKRKGIFVLREANKRGRHETNSKCKRKVIEGL